MKKHAMPILWSSLLAVAACSHPGNPSRAGSTVGDQLPFPAFSPDVPQVVSLGGPVMDSPQAVAITFPGDPLADKIEQFVSGIGATEYWAATTAEYGVGTLTALPPIRLTEAAPAAITDDEIQAWLAAKLDGTHPEFPAPGINTVYTIFYPSTTVIDEGGSKSCQAFGGYHNSTSANGSSIVYAVLPRCAGLRDVTVAGSHELVEAATDPEPLDDAAYLEVDPRHAIWARLTGGGGEVGDMCAQFDGVEYTPDDFPFVVQRSWSNAAAAAGQDPCVPAPTDRPYFNASARTPTDDITFNGFGGTVDTAGWSIPVGTSKTLVFEIYSTAPMDQPIDLTAVDLSAQRQNKPPTLAFEFDQPSGHNGARVHLTVTALAASSSRSGVTSFEVRSSADGVTHPWLGLVQAQ